MLLRARRTRALVLLHARGNHVVLELLQLAKQHRGRVGVEPGRIVRIVAGGVGGKRRCNVSGMPIFVRGVALLLQHLVPLALPLVLKPGLLAAVRRGASAPLVYECLEHLHELAAARHLLLLPIAGEIGVPLPGRRRAHDAALDESGAQLCLLRSRQFRARRTQHPPENPDRAKERKQAPRGLKTTGNRTGRPETGPEDRNVDRKTGTWTGKTGTWTG
eukprot:7377838-Prymnesium_polylepis.3